MLKKLFVTFFYILSNRLVLTLLTVLLSNTALALGLGNIIVLSKLNEPLDVEIEVLDTGTVPIDDIIVRNAQRQTYKKANLFSPEVFNKVHFKIIKKPDGSVVAKLTSKRPVKEPFITFIADMKWRNGHISREYTFLLDPPKFVQKHSQPRYTAKKSLASNKQSLATNNKPETRTTTVTNAQKNFQHIIASHRSERSYTTRRSDTLWKIAEKFRPDSGVNTWQTMQAIFVLNQNAFINGDINLLKQNQTLSLPDSNEVRQINGKVPLKKTPGLTNAPSESYELVAQKSPSRVIEPTRRHRKSTARKEEKPSDKEQLAEKQGRLKIIPPNETLINKPVTSKKDLLLINKALKTSMDTIKLLQTENEILIAQVDSLNEKINTLDSQNSDLSKQITEITRLLKDMRTTEDLKTARLGSESKVLANNAVNTSEATQLKPERNVQNKQSHLSIATTGQNKAEGSVLSIESTTTQAKTSQRTFLQELLSNPINTLALAVFAIIVLIGGYLAFKKQKGRDTNQPASDEQPVLSSFQQNSSTAIAEKNIIERSVNDSTSEPDRQTNSIIEKNEDEMDFFEYFEKKINAPDETDTSTLKNTASTQTSTENNSDVDFSLELSEQDIKDYEQSISQKNSDTEDTVERSIPEALSEVDTYIAYGNYEEAENILTSEIIKAPLNKDLNLKLFECYALANKRYEFIQHIKQVINMLNENMVLRHRVENIYQQAWNETLDITQLS